MTPTRDRAAWLLGGEAHCNLPPTEVKRAWRVVLLGPPGVGKGTQAEYLTRALGACHLSTGDVFRAAKNQPVAAGSAMAEAQACMSCGKLVSDKTVLALVHERGQCLHCSGGFLLDGFPRTLHQAQALDTMLEHEKVRLDAAISLELPDSQLISRLSGRRVCSMCKAVFHITTRKPLKPGVCDHCSGPLVQRSDDFPEAVAVRLATYHADSEPVAGYYRRKNLLVSIPAAGEPGEIFARTLDALATLPAAP